MSTPFQWNSDGPFLIGPTGPLIVGSDPGTSAPFRVGGYGLIECAAGTQALTVRGASGSSWPQASILSLDQSSGMQFAFGARNVGATAYFSLSQETSPTSLLMQAGTGLGVSFPTGPVAVGGSVYVHDTTLLHSSQALNNGAGAQVGTLNNAPATGNPTKWIPVDDNGTTRYVPAW